jgi:hypothetical protein
MQVALEPNLAFNDFMRAQHLNFERDNYQSNENNNQNFLKKIHEFTNHPLINPILAFGDVSSAVTDFMQLPNFTKKLIDNGSLFLTKAMMVLRYAETGISALQKNRIVEALGRFLGIGILPLAKIYDLNMASGLAEFIPQIDLSLESKLGKEKTYTSFSENINLWKKAFLKNCSEIKAAGLGAKRKILPDFNIEQIKKIFNNIWLILSGKKNLNFTSKEKGHTLTFAGIINFIGAGIGVTLGRSSRNIWNKIGGSVRVLGSMIADFTLLSHNDREMNKAGMIFTVAGLIDLVQRFLPDKYLNTINHINIINTMLGTQIIANRTHQKNALNYEVY